MNHEMICSDLLFYDDRLSFLIQTIDILSQTSDIADAFCIPVELLRDTVAGLAELHSDLRKSLKEAGTDRE